MEDNVNSSPLPPKEPDLLTFTQAMKLIQNGKKVTKKEWNNLNIYCFVGIDGHLKINLPEKLTDWIIRDVDMGDDWVVLEDKN